MLYLSGCDFGNGESDVPYQPVNPALITMTPSGDTAFTALGNRDSIGLPGFASAGYHEEDSTIRFSKAYDTLTFTYKSYTDNVYSNTMSDVKFWMIREPGGSYLIQAEVAAYYDDVVSIGPERSHSLNASGVYKGGLPKGNYELEVRARDFCFCQVQPAPAVFKARFSVR
jgi:hypothetical protein